MKPYPAPLDLKQVRVFPLAQRESLSSIDKLLVDPDANPAALEPTARAAMEECAERMQSARKASSSVMLLYGAHLIKNGGMLIVNRLIEKGWLTHLATNGAGTIHDWELAFLGRTEESVRRNVAAGTFGTWDETGRNIQLALLAGGVRQEGYGQSLGRFIAENGTTLPEAQDLRQWISEQPSDPLTAARADLLHTIESRGLKAGRVDVRHPWKNASILATAFRQQIPFTVHPGIGYDIFTTHPLFNGAVVGRAAGIDFALFSRAVEGLDGGVVLSVGSAIMAPQVFEKSLSCVNNLRLQSGRKVVRDHTIYVIDIQDGGHWDWSQGEPPKDNPAYYLRFCKSFARMGGTMRYVQIDNVAFLHQLLRRLES